MSARVFDAAARGLICECGSISRMRFNSARMRSVKACDMKCSLRAPACGGYTPHGPARQSQIGSRRSALLSGVVATGPVPVEALPVRCCLPYRIPSPHSPRGRGVGGEGACDSWLSTTTLDANGCRRIDGLDLQPVTPELIRDNSPGALFE